ncbi:MAG: LysM peptidoglycan-binding domain-containing protein [Pseudomonadota bacterium]
MKFLTNLSVSRVSSGFTAIVCSGFLINAVLTDNGGTPNSQENWRDSKANNQSIVDRLSQKSYAEWKAEQDRLDRTITNSIGVNNGQNRNTHRPSVQRQEPSVLSLIRENADIAPSVSSGTGRVSITVKKGDTLFAIAQRHGLTVLELARLNSLSEPYTIHVNQTLYVAR